MPFTRVAIVVFIAAVALGPLYTAAGYSPVRHVISQLAAQNTPNHFVMVGAFVVLGAAILVEGVRDFRPPLVPFMAFGLLFGAAGLFGHRPLEAGVAYSPWVDAVHSGLATASGIALTVGFVWQAIRARTFAYRWQTGALALVCVALPLFMLWQPSIQGLVQRAMYTLIFLWIWVHYPRSAHV